jgi:hypothetical protein
VTAGELVYLIERLPYCESLPVYVEVVNGGSEGKVESVETGTVYGRDGEHVIVTVV